MKKIITCMITFFATFVMVINGANALESVNASLSTNHNDLYSGEEVEITLKFDGFNDIKKGINAYKATLDYDENIFEQVFQNSFACLNGWEEILYNPSNKEFVSINRVGITKPGAVAKIKLKVKEGMKPTKTSIKVRDVVVSEGKKDIEVKTATNNLNIVTTQSSIPSEKDPNNTSLNKPVNNVVLGTAPRSNSFLDKALKVSDDIAELEKQENLGEDNITSITDNSDKSIKDSKEKETKKIKKTSHNYLNLFLLFLIELIILFVIIFIVRKRKENNGGKDDIDFSDKQKKFMSFFIIGILSFEFVGTVFAATIDFAQKGELNDDGEINYADVNLLQLHLIDLKEIEDDKLENADINSDGKITVTDLTLLIQKLEKTLDYEVTLSDLRFDNYYPNKNEDVTLKFDASVSFGAYIEKVVVNGKEYDVIKQNDSDEYGMMVNVGDASGVKEYKITEVILNNGKTVSVNNSVKLDVLKTKPSISNYSVTEDDSDVANLKANISFDFTDNDDSMTSGVITVKNDKDEVVKAGIVKKGKNTLEVPVQDGKMYKVYVSVKYDLDTNELKQEKDNTGTLSFEKDLRIVIEYDFEISNIKTYKDDNMSTTFEKKEPIQIRFESSNLSNYEPTEITVNGTNYTVKKEGNIYVADTVSFDDLGDNNVTVESVTLGNGKKFEIKKDNKLSVKIIKRKPSAGDITWVENVSDGKLTVKFKLTDNDNAIKNAKIILSDENGDEISNKDLTLDEIKDGNIEKVLDTKVTSKYKVKVIATYNQNVDDIETTLLEKEINALPNAKIKSVSANNKYLEKNGVAVLTYTIDSNKTINVSKIRVNNVDCIAEKLEDGKYKVSYEVGDDSGITSLTATKLIFSDNSMADVNKTIKVEVLKDAPMVNNFTLEDDIDNASVNVGFEVKDVENTFISGKAVLTNTEDGTSVSKDINKGMNELTFKVKNTVKYNLDIKVTYDRDTNSLEDTDDSDNLIENKVLLSKKVQQLSDYEVKITELKTYNGETENKYFAKNSPITVSFESTNITDFVPVQAVINGKLYDLTNADDVYSTTTDSYDVAGVKNIVIEEVIFDNSKRIKLDGTDLVKVEILKDEPKVKDFNYKENTDNTVTMSFNLEDSDKALKSSKIVVTDENDNEVKAVNITSGENEVSFDLGSSQVYDVKIIADYDLDTNGLDNSSNEFTNKVLDVQTINIGARLFEMKDIVSFNVYRQTADGVVVTEKLKEEDLSNLDDYIVKVQLKQMPTFHTKIKEYKVEDNKLKLTLDYDDIVQYDGNNRQNKLELVYGDMNNGEATNVSLESLAQKIMDDPSGTFTLTRDYDASLLSSSSASALFGTSFSGTLNGNGYKIYNLSKPLFDTLEAGTIENLTLENVSLSGTSRGTVANVATNATITNVHVKDLAFATGLDRSGGILGEGTSTDIENSSVSQLNLTTAKARIGGIVGQTTGGNITNCYVDGNITATSTKDGNGIGGIVGTAEASPTTTIENCLTKIKFDNASGHRLNGAIIGLALNSTAVLNNNVSLSTGEKVYSVHGYAIHASSTNNYELEGSGLTSNASGDVVKTVAKDAINKDFFKDNAKFDEAIWKLDGASYDNVPVLKGSISKEETKVETPSNSKLYIPDYSRIKKIHGFSESKEILYHNINKLMPYYDAKYLIEDGNKNIDDNALNEKAIKHIIPYNSEGKMLTYLTNDNHNSIAKIKVVFDDNKINEYNVSFKELKQNISIYEIEGLPLEYAYDNYVMKEDAAIVNTLSEYINSVDYATVLEPLTTAADARHYKDHYNETMKPLAKTIALQLLHNDSNNALTMDSDILNNKIKEEFIDSGKINKILYAYNYYYRWYNFEIGGTKVSDLMFFEGKTYKDTMTIDNLTNEVLTGNMGVNVTDSFFKTNLAKYTGSSDLRYFLDGIITNIGGYEDVNDWFTEYFGSRNILAEFGVDKNPDILYRGWYQIKKNSKMILPIITLPVDCAYIISGPAHLQIGPSQLYHKDVNTDAGRNAVRSKVNDHVTLVKRHLSTLAGSFDPGKWNNYCIMVYDCTKIITGYKNSYFPGTNIVIGTSPVYTQGKVGQNYPFFKNFSEVFGLWQPGGSAAGVGNTAGFLWFIARQGLTNYDTWTHEFEHALFDKIMLFQAGTRFKAGLETLTEGNVQQNGVWSENNLLQDVGPYYFNTSFYLNKEGNATQNLSPDRIDTREKLENYFKGQQNALDLLDYIEGKAFIRLTPEQQARVATRMNQSGSWSTWGAITAAQAEKMNLTSLESLYDNRIIIRPENAWGVSVRGLSVINSLGSNDYGFESVWVNRWYIGHNDNGIPDAFSAKRNYFEMLGYAGVDGYVTYGRGNTKTDLDAIQKITKSVTGTAMNWKEYKMSRYATVEENLKNNKYIDADYMIERFYQAFASDTNRNAVSRTSLRKIYYHYLKSVTNDFVADPLGTDTEVTHIKTAEELVQKINDKPYGYYVLDNDIDFSNMTTNVTNTFMGRLDGKGHKIIGNTLPIFNKIRYGYVGNIVFENTNIPKTISNAGALSYKSESSTIEKISASNLQMNFGGRNDVSLIGGAVNNLITRDCTVEKFTYHIKTADDIAKLNEDTSGIFVIDNDIDFTGYTGNGSVVTGTFNGKIDGQGHTFKNLSGLSLFSQFNGTVGNLNIKNFTNVNPGNATSNDDIAAFAKYSNGATFKNMKFENITLEGRNRVATVVTFDNLNSTFENISVVNANVKGSGVYVSTFIGRKYGGTIKNVYVQGTIDCTTTENGGLIGALQKGGVIENAVTNVEITKSRNTDGQNRQLNAGFIGNIYLDGTTPVIRNSISIGNMKGYIDNTGNELIPYKFTGATEGTILATMVNCYEYAVADGTSSITEGTANSNLKGATKENVYDRRFYIDILSFDEEYWDFDDLDQTGYPKLKVDGHVEVLDI